MRLFDGVPVDRAVCRADELDVVSLNRKKSRSLSFTAWSKRTLVESIDAGLDQLPKNWPNPFLASSTPLGLGNGNALIAVRTALAAGFLPDGQAPIALMQRSGTKMSLLAACGAVRRNPS